MPIISPKLITYLHSLVVYPHSGGGAYVPGSAAPMDTGGSGYSDPFTGGGRYVPGSGSNPARSNKVSSVGADPFTGKNLIMFVTKCKRLLYSIACIAAARLPLKIGCNYNDTPHHSEVSTRPISPIVPCCYEICFYCFLT